MAAHPVSLRRAAKQDYIEGCELPEISRRLDVLPKTLAKWRNEDGWVEARKAWVSCGETLPENLQRIAQSLEAAYHDELRTAKEIADLKERSKALSKASSSGTRAVYALATADQRYAAHKRAGEADPARVVLAMLTAVLSEARVSTPEIYIRVTDLMEKVGQKIKKQGLAGLIPPLEEERDGI